MPLVDIPIPNHLISQYRGDYLRLLQEFFEALQQSEAKRVTSRLNATNETNASPVWAGTRELSEVRNRLTPTEQDDLGRRFMGPPNRFTNRSEAYNEALTNRSGDVIWRDWNRQQELSNYKTPSNEHQSYGPKQRCNWQAFVAIRVNTPAGRSKHVGTLTAGFQEEPSPSRKNEVEDIMKQWAQDSNSRLILYLQSEFNLGGPEY